MWLKKVLQNHPDRCPVAVLAARGSDSVPIATWRASEPPYPLWCVCVMTRCVMPSASSVGCCKEYFGETKYWFVYPPDWSSSARNDV
jgi:hypothetical protein